MVGVGVGVWAIVVGVGVVAEPVLGGVPPPQAASRRVAHTTSRQHQAAALRRDRCVCFNLMCLSFSQNIRQRLSCTANMRRLNDGPSSPARCAILVSGVPPCSCSFSLNAWHDRLRLEGCRRWRLSRVIPNRIGSIGSIELTRTVASHIDRPILEPHPRIHDQDTMIELIGNDD